ncbi:nuclease-related domain-containing protein [Geotalea sp. SG265]|uniref:nuclease-related domain-containing protein n=1 Tax=Geotalea sp. SG265 TaxID=2922867 RepID=UPI001FB00D38|nr:nuclease-related domain-containing protein [Geotalea sp. SG265]
MAKMIPAHGPAPTNSYSAELLLYSKLSECLDDSFIVIHSIPWLTAAVQEFGLTKAPTGEIDFLIIHGSLGFLAIEVKGGRIATQDGSFVVTSTGERIDPIGQVRNSIHGLSRWLYANNKQALRIGYAIAFPESVTTGKPLPPALYDAR